MKRSVITLVLVVASVTPALAQNPCTDPTPPLTLNPVKVYVPIAEFDATELDGGPKISHFSYALFAEGADPNTAKPVQGPSTMPKNAFTLVSGTPDCYVADVPAPIPTSQRLVGHFKAMREARVDVPAAQSAWNASSNPFGAPSSVLATMGAAKFRQ